MHEEREFARGEKRTRQKKTFSLKMVIIDKLFDIKYNYIVIVVKTPVKGV